MKATNPPSINPDIWRGVITATIVGLLASFAVWIILLCSLTMAMFIGLTGWVIVMCSFPAVFDGLFFTVNANYGLVLADRFKTDMLEPDENGKLPDSPTKSMRECQPGIHGKWFWEYNVAVFDTRKKLSLECPLTVYDKANVKWLVRYQAALTPLYGHLVNLARISETTAQKYFQGFFEVAINTEMKKTDGYEKQGHLGEFSDWFKNLLGGPDHISEDEKRHGMFTNTPQILEMTADEAVQAANEEVMKARARRNAMKEYDGLDLTDREKLDRIVPDVEIISVSVPKHATNLQTLIVGGDKKGK